MPEPFDPTRPGVYIGTSVRELREHRGLTQGELSQASGLDTRALVWLETGSMNDLLTSTLCALARALRVEPATLLPKRLPAERKRKEAQA